jgi:hypothetical protein
LNLKVNFTTLAVYRGLRSTVNRRRRDELRAVEPEPLGRLAAQAAALTSAAAGWQREAGA